YGTFTFGVSPSVRVPLPETRVSSRPLERLRWPFSDTLKRIVVCLAADKLPPAIPAPTTATSSPNTVTSAERVAIPAGRITSASVLISGRHIRGAEADSIVFPRRCRDVETPLKSPGAVGCPGPGADPNAWALTRPGPRVNL